MDRNEAIFASLARERKARKSDQSVSKAKQLLDRCFGEQRAAIEDDCRRKALLCPARAGKSFTCAVYILYVLLTVPRANVLYIAFIRSQAKEILWNLLKRLDEEFQLGLHFGEQELTVTNGKGSFARLAGCESWGDVDKFRGIPRHLVILDEAATWHAKLLEDLILQVIEPRLGDYKGTLVMTGTPGDVLAGPFYLATGPQAASVVEGDDGGPRAVSRPYAERDAAHWQAVTWRWSLHGWAKSANTSPEGQSAWHEALDLKHKNGWSDDNPIWVREHLGRWMADDSTLIFRYSPANDWRPGERTPENPFGLPAGYAWRFVVSVDMGFHDPFALQVGAFSDTHPDLFMVYEDEGTRLSIGAVAEKVQHALDLIDEGAVDVMVADLQGLGGMVVETLAAEHQLFFEKLEQRDKRDHIELMNSALVDKRIRVVAGSRLAHEMTYLAWDATGLKARPNQPNHHCDAALGVVRHSRHLDAVTPVEKPKTGTREWIEAEERKEEERAAAGARKRQREQAEGSLRAEFSNWLRE